jgi:hypothetical protein
LYSIALKRTSPSAWIEALDRNMLRWAEAQSDLWLTRHSDELVTLFG